MEVRFAPELEAKVNRVAAATGRGAGQYVQELVAQYIDHDAWFRREVAKGRESARRDDLLEQAEVVEFIERLFRS